MIFRTFYLSALCAFALVLTGCLPNNNQYQAPKGMTCTKAHDNQWIGKTICDEYRPTAETIAPPAFDL